MIFDTDAHTNACTIRDTPSLFQASVWVCIAHKDINKEREHFRNHFATIIIAQFLGNNYEKKYMDDFDFEDKKLLSKIKKIKVKMYKEISLCKENKENIEDYYNKKIEYLTCFYDY